MPKGLISSSLSVPNSPTGGHFRADFPLSAYLEFAYKLWPHEFESREFSRLPKWVLTDRYSIEARGRSVRAQARSPRQAGVETRPSRRGTALRKARCLARSWSPRLSLELRIVRVGHEAGRGATHVWLARCDDRLCWPAPFSAPYLQGSAAK